MTASDYAAWYAAALATVIAVWDFVKWRKSGPSIAGDAKTGWQSFGISETEGMSLSVANLTNRGDQPTTLKSWGLYWYPPGASTKEKTKRKAFVVKPGLAGCGIIPKKLEPGDTWQGLLQENEKHADLLTTGKLYFGFGLSHSDEELLIELKKG